MIDKQILFISELGHEQKVPRDYRHMRTEFAQMCALQSDHCPIYKINQFSGGGYDHVILLISKTPQLRDFILTFDLVEKSLVYAGSYLLDTSNNGIAASNKSCKYLE